MLAFILLTLLVSPLALGQDVLDNLSFGHKKGISSNSFEIADWTMSGYGHSPLIMSDRVILTPPYGGGKRGALWSKNKIQIKEWAVKLDFRAAGVDNGKGNLQMWYAKDGEKALETASIYTAGKFDGLAVVIDTNGGVQKIRGFLNDGSIDYRSHPNVDSLAFGHCDYNYRNLGRPSKLGVEMSSSGLQIMIDDKKCFSTTKVALPIDYYYGVTAASTDPPDSFEIFKFETSTISSPGGTAAAPRVLNDKTETKDSPSSQKDSSGSSVAVETQLKDLNARLDQLSKSISSMFTEINQNTKAEEQRYQEILKQLPSNAVAGNLESKLSNLDRILNDLASELKGGNHKEQFAKIAEQLEKTNVGLTQHLPGKMREYVQNHTPRIGFIVFSFMAFQSCCLAILLWQKYRKSTMPKKFL